MTASASATNQGIAAAEAAGVATAATEEFRNIPLNQIIVERQIRTGIDMEDESSQGFIDSVAEKGVIEPVIVTPRGEKFLLLAGERRFLACQKLGLETIPARILPNVQSGEEILTIQLIENLHRQDIDPIDKANGILAFFQNRHSGMDLDAIMNDLILYDREDQRVPGDIVATVATISKIAGIKARSIQNVLSLLRLSQEMRDSVKTGTIPVSQGYIFAANLENPGLMTVFESVLANPVTNKRLTELLKKAAAQGDAEPTEEAPAPFKSLYGTIQTTTSRLESGKVLYDVIELENLLLQLRSLIDLVERAKAGGGTAAEATPPAGGKKPVLA